MLCAASNGSDGEAVLVGEAEDLRDLLGVGWGDDDRVFVLAHVVWAGDGGELIGDGHCWY